MSFYILNNEYYDSYGYVDPLGISYNTIGNIYHHSSSTIKYKRSSIDNFFHSFSFFSKNHNVDRRLSESKKNKENKNNKIYIKALTSQTPLNTLSLNHNNSNNNYNSNENDRINRIKLSKYNERYSDLIYNSSVYQPTINVEENENEYRINVYLLDIKRNEIKIDLNGDNIIIHGERGRKSKKYTKFTKFNRMFTVPTDADINSIQVSFQNQILEIVLKKK
ncbi:hypothetical protein BCR36DRAFT_584680 [Piromyces finnis]|uniref:SHSP domain-containing protein n=1 Tax=Piromyces finnis TaxID=1754191 RepID=A0A1Y1V580_9FUNG|nr:hypothetical protein BCR36DRAFT_584680 [Piromyces finnis]|eukprot:ORX47585.1 hypothetical protein BCR36DRAFT_584680 [Piromyces finnis]